jgi:hypothetical protein
VEAVTRGVCPKSLPRDHPARDYAGAWNNLSVLDGEEDTIVLYDRRKIVVLAGARKGILETLHIPHNGADKTWENAREKYFWPSMKTQIAQMTGKCEECVAGLLMRKKEKLQTGSSSMEELEPMDEVAVDLFSINGENHLAMVDRASGFLRHAALGRTDSVTVQEALMDW